MFLAHVHIKVYHSLQRLYEIVGEAIYRQKDYGVNAFQFEMVVTIF